MRGFTGLILSAETTTELDYHAKQLRPSRLDDRGRVESRVFHLGNGVSETEDADDGTLGTCGRGGAGNLSGCIRRATAGSLRVFAVCAGCVGSSGNSTSAQARRD